MWKGQNIIDGELVVFNKKGKDDFNLLSKRSHLKYGIQEAQKLYPAKLVAFDVLQYNNVDMRKKQWNERNKLLQHFKLPNVNIIKSYPLNKTNSIMKGHEGVVFKKTDSIYDSPKNNNWLKLKNEKQADLLVTGYQEGEGKRKGMVGAVNVAYRKNNKLINVGSVGSFKGMDEEQLKQLKQRLDNKQKTFVKVQYLEMGAQGKLRMPKVIGIRSDITEKQTHVDEQSKNDMRCPFCGQNTNIVSIMKKGCPKCNSKIFTKEEKEKDKEEGMKMIFGEDKQSKDMVKYHHVTDKLRGHFIKKEGLKPHKQLQRGGPQQSELSNPNYVYVFKTKPHAKIFQHALNQNQSMPTEIITFDVPKKIENKMQKDTSFGMLQMSAHKLKGQIPAEFIVEDDSSQQKYVYKKGKYHQTQHGPIVIALANKIKKQLQPYTQKVEIAGSIRRKILSPVDVDIVAIPKDKEKIKQQLLNMGGKQLYEGEQKIGYRINGIKVEIDFTNDKSWGAQLMQSTGPWQGNLGNRTLAKNNNMLLNNKGLFKRNDGYIVGRTEKEIYNKLGKEYKQPEIRGQ